MNDFLELLSYPFVLRAVIAGSLISICASVLGVILILKHYSLIGHGLAEVGFASLSIASALHLPAITLTTPAVITASFAIMYVSQRYRTAGDTAIAIASSIALSVGVIVSSVSGQTSNMSSYLFGSILAMNDSDVIFSVVLSGAVMIVFVIFYNRLFLITYNEDYARSLGINTALYQAIISVLTALVIVMGMRFMGTLLISSVIILPAVSARNIASGLSAQSGFRLLVLLSGIISLIAFILGLMVSFMINLPAGASIVLVNAVILAAIKVLFRK